MRSLTILILISALALAGCTDDSGGDDGTDTQTQTETSTTTGTGDGGDGGDGGSAGENVTVDITWSGAYPATGEYDKDTITVPANSTVTLTFTNDDPVSSHDFVVEGIEGASTAVLEPGDSETITFEVGAPQETAFFCSVPGHRGNGMEGTFIVE